MANLTQKQADQLNAAKTETIRLWNLMCQHDGIEPTSKFAMFSSNNPYSAQHGEAMTTFFKLRNKFRRSLRAQERREYSAPKPRGWAEPPMNTAA